MRCCMFAAAGGLFLTVLAGCGDDAPPPAATPSDDQQPAPPPPPPPPPGVAEVPTGPSTGRPAGPAGAYPRFPDAITEPPPWNDAEPPFNLAEFLQAPPDEENAAPLYLDALFEFQDIGYSLFSEEEWKRRGPIVRQRWKEYYRLYQSRQKDPGAVDKVAVDAWLTQYDVGFEKLAAAQRRPRCVFQTGLSFHSLLGHAMTAREVAQVVEWRTRRDLERGDLERPIQGIETVLRLSRDLRPRGVAVCQLVSIAVDGICCQQMVPAILTAPAVETRHCDRLLVLLAEHEAKAIDPFLEANRAQYFIDRKILHDLQHRTGSFDPQYLKQYFKERRGAEFDVNSPLACITFLVRQTDVAPLAIEKHGAWARGRQPPGGADAPTLPLLPGAFSGGKMLADDDYVKEVDALNRVHASILALADQPNLRRTGDYKTVILPLCEPLRETTLAVFLVDRGRWITVFVTLRAEATLRGTQCLVALRRWQLEHAELPRDLDTLVKDAGMAGVPMDPYSDQPLRMAMIGGKPVIYSVGPDGRDDKALLESKGGRQPGDIIFRLEPPLN